MPNYNNSANWSPVYKLCVAATNSKQLTSNLVSRWKHWEQFKGPEWLVERAKALLNIAKLQLDNRFDDAISLAKEKSIAINPISGRVSGPEGTIVQSIVYGRRSTKKRNMLVLRFYTGITLPNATKKQVDKVFASINAVSDRKPGFYGEFSTTRKDWLNNGNQQAFRPGFEPFKAKDLKLGTLGDLKALSSYPRLVKSARSNLKTAIDQENIGLPYEKMVGSLLSKGFVPQSLLDCYPSESPFYLQGFAQGHQAIAGSDTLGSVVFIQEPGGKLRPVGSPNAWIQFYMRPLHNYLDNIIQTEECTYTSSNIYYGISAVKNQPRGIDAAYSLVMGLEKSFIGSVDLTGATDRFPLNIQKDFLTAHGLGNFATAFNDLIGPYDAPDGEIYSYNVGQPMGINGSFPLFHLTHLFLLRKLCYSLRLDNKSVHFAVLGDDVLFFNKELHEVYRNWMNTNGVKISEQKSFHNTISEFASCMIFEDGIKPFRPYKWGSGFQFGPVIHTLNALGSRSRNLGKYWSSAYDLFIKTIGQRDLVLNPLVPTDQINPGVSQKLNAEYFLNLVSQLESRSISANINSLVPPGLINNLEKDLVRLLPKENQLVVKSFDPLSFIEDETWYNRSRIEFSKDPLIKEAKLMSVKSDLKVLYIDD